MTSVRSSSGQRHLLELVVLASLSGLLYCSWPLGYLLNPTANRGLASNLEGLGQPYNWLFIALDIMSGALVGAVAWWLLRGLVKEKNRLVTVAIINYALFGFFTSLDAVLPVDCAADQQQCGPLINHPAVIIHGLISLGSIGFLTISLVLMWWLLSRRRTTPPRLRLSLHLGMVIWFFFGIITAVLIALNRSSALSQHVFILACSVWTGVFPYIIHHYSSLLPKRNQHRPALVVKSRLGV